MGNTHSLHYGPIGGCLRFELEEEARLSDTGFGLHGKYLPNSRFDFFCNPPKLLFLLVPANKLGQSTPADFSRRVRNGPKPVTSKTFSDSLIPFTRVEPLGWSAK